MMRDKTQGPERLVLPQDEEVKCNEGSNPKSVLGT